MSYRVVRLIRWIRVRFILIREIRSPLKLTEYHILVDAHPLEGEEAAAQVLEGGPEMVEGVVEDEEAVVEAAAVLPQLHPPAILLLVQLLQMLQRLADVLGVYRGIDTLAALLEQVEDGGVDVVVYQDDFPLRRLDEGLDESVGIEDLAFEEHALHWWLVSPHEEVNLLLMVGKGLFYLHEMLLVHLCMSINTGVDTLLHLF